MLPHSSLTLAPFTLSRLVYVDPAWMAIVSEQAASKNFMGSEHACGKGRNWGQLEASSASRHNIHDKFRKVFHVVHVADDKTCEPYLCWGVIRKVFFLHLKGWGCVLMMLVKLSPGSVNHLVTSPVNNPPSSVYVNTFP